jgi:protein-L-isoaspartate O-methyltransferase
VRALDVGSGSGYFTTLMSSMMKDGYVYGIEMVKELTKTSMKNI